MDDDKEQIRGCTQCGELVALVRTQHGGLRPYNISTGIIHFATCAGRKTVDCRDCGKPITFLYTRSGFLRAIDRETGEIHQMFCPAHPRSGARPTQPVFVPRQ